MQELFSSLGNPQQRRVIVRLRRHLERVDEARSRKSSTSSFRLDTRSSGDCTPRNQRRLRRVIVRKRAIAHAPFVNQHENRKQTNPSTSVGRSSSSLKSPTNSSSTPRDPRCNDRSGTTVSAHQPRSRSDARARASRDDVPRRRRNRRRNHRSHSTSRSTRTRRRDSSRRPTTTTSTSTTPSRRRRRRGRPSSPRASWNDESVVPERPTDPAAPAVDFFFDP